MFILSEKNNISDTIVEQDERTHQLFFELGKDINERLVTFFRSNRELLQQTDAPEDEDDLRSYMAQTALQNVLNGARKRAEISVSGTRNSSSRRTFRNRWTSDYKKSYKTSDFSNESNKFFPIYQRHQVLSKSEWNSLFGTQTLEDYITFTMDNINAWKADTSLFLIDFPLLDLQPEKSIRNVFWKDVASEIIRTVSEKFDGTLDSYILSVPSSFAKTPLFCVRSSDIEDVPDYYYPNKKSDSYLLTSPRDSEFDSALRRLDSVDLTIVNYVLAKVRVDSEFLKNRYVSFDYSELVHFCFGKKPSSVGYVDIQRRLLNLTALRDEWHYNGGSVSFTYFDRVVIPPEPTNKDSDIKIYFASTMFEAVTQHMLISVTKFDFDKLSNPLSRILIHTIQNERILCALEENNEAERMCRTYDRYFFTCAARITPSYPKRELDQIKAALDDYAIHNVFIRKSEVCDDTIEIWYEPLTKQELQDLENYNTYQHLDVSRFQILGISATD